MTEAVGASAPLKAIIQWGNRAITWAVYLSYPVLLVLLALQKNTALPAAVLIPGISFVLLSIFRDRVNAPRPYEVFGVPPVIVKNTKGHSFPSRHVFSIFVIAVTMYRFCPAAGILIGIAGLFLGAGRILGGVHFPRDVIAGTLIGIGCGILGFYVILPMLQIAG